MVYFLPLIYLIWNRVRGTTGKGGIIGGVLTAGILFFLTSNSIASILAGIFYIIGESWGWGKWLITVPHWGDSSWQKTFNETLLSRDDGKNNGIHFIADAVFPQEKKFASYAKFALILRGLWWWVPIFITLYAFSLTSIIGVLVGSLLVSIPFPFLYRFAYDKLDTDFWPWGEYLYGFFQGLALMIVLLV